MTHISEKNLSTMQYGDLASAKVISLRESKDRRHRLVAAGFPSDLVRRYHLATDLRGASDDVLASASDRRALLRTYEREVRPAEIGCAVSHRDAYRILLEEDTELGWIFEDDNRPLHSDTFKRMQKLADLLQPRAARAESFICNVGMPETLSTSMRARAVTNHDDVTVDLKLYCDSFRRVWRANAYLISREAMVRLIAHQNPISYLADDWSAHFWSGRLRIYFPTQPLFAQDTSLESTVQIPDAPTFSEHLASRIISERIRSSLCFRTARLRSAFISNIPHRL